MKRMLTMGEVQKAAWHCAERLLDYESAMAACRGTLGKELLMYGVPRGGIPAAALVAAAMSRNLVTCQLVNEPELAHAFIDDIIDSGATRDSFARTYPGVPFLALYEKGVGETRKEWLVFPWEVSRSAGDESHTDIATRLLQFVGEDPSREGLKDTPGRFAAAWQHYTSGYQRSAQHTLTAFEDGSSNYNELVLVSNIPVYSHCEHHLTPMFGLAHVGYIPSGKIVGLSKIARLVDIFARRLQVQERMTVQVATEFESMLEPKGVGVVMQLRHLCMESRGVAAYGSVTTTSALRGCLANSDRSRAEFLQLVNQGKNGKTV